LRSRVGPSGATFVFLCRAVGLFGAVFLTTIVELLDLLDDGLAGLGRQGVDLALEDLHRVRPAGPHDERGDDRHDDDDGDDDDDDNSVPGSCNDEDDDDEGDDD